MAARPLLRLGIVESSVGRLADSGVRTAADLLSLGVIELAELLDLAPGAAREMLCRVSAEVAPTPYQVLHLHQAGAALHVPTFLQGLDDALRGGVPPGAITELVGPAGVGKTQLCLMLALSALARAHLMPRHQHHQQQQQQQQQPGQGSDAPGMLAAGGSSSSGGGGGSVLYIDTERKFSATRLAEMAAARFGALLPGGPRDASRLLLPHVLVMHPGSTRELTQRLQDLEHSLIERRVVLVVLDSVASLARMEFGAGETVERQQQLSMQAALLKRYADTFRLPVVVTNHITTVIGGGRASASHGFQQQQQQQQQQGGGGGGAVSGSDGPSSSSSSSHLTAALGTVWAHAVNNRLALHYSRGGGRRIEIAKSPSAPHVSFPYVITALGLEQLPAEDGGNGGGGGGGGGPGNGGGAGGGVVGMAIDNDVRYFPST